MAGPTRCYVYDTEARYSTPSGLVWRQSGTHNDRGSSWHLRDGRGSDTEAETGLQEPRASARVPLPSRFVCGHKQNGTEAESV